MVAVHDGTANININNVINVTKCSECKYGEFFHSLDETNVMYLCHLFGEWIDEKSAELEELGCDGFELDDRYDDFTAQS